MTDLKPDDVDDIQLAWQREHPGLPVRSIGVLTRLWRVGKLLADDRRRRMAGLGIEPAMRDLLATLRRAGPPYALSPTEIAQRAGVTPGAVSQRVARAETHGWVERARLAGPGRRAEVRLTDAGHRVINEVVVTLMRDEEALLSSLTGSQQDRLADLLRILLADLTGRAGRPDLDL